MTKEEIFLQTAIRMNKITMQQANFYLTQYRTQQRKIPFSMWLQNMNYLNAQLIQEIEQYILQHSGKFHQKIPDSFFDKKQTHTKQTSLTQSTIQTKKNIKLGEMLHHYLIQKELGRGGMGVVYQALDKRLNRLVALKVILNQKQIKQKQIEQFKQEARAIAQINHPFITQIFDISESPDNYFTMEYVFGETLKHHIQNSEWTFDKIAEFIEKCAIALNVVHNQGIIHRDLKPANIIVDKKKNPKIMDFGLAQGINVAKKDSGFMGTPSYASPEQAHGKKTITKHSDIYSLGAVLYESLCKRAPYQGNSAFNILYQILECEIVHPRILNPDIPIELEAICLKCMKKQKKQRYQSMKQFAQDLKCYQEGKPTIAKPLTTWQRSNKWIKRNKTISFLVSIFFLTFIALSITGFSWYYTASSKVRLETSYFELLNKSKKLDEKNIEIEKENNELSQENIHLDQKMTESNSRLYTQKVKIIINAMQLDNTHLEKQLKELKQLKNKSQQQEWELRWIFHEQDLSMATFKQSTERENFFSFFDAKKIKSHTSHHEYLWKENTGKSVRVKKHKKPIGSFAMSSNKKWHASIIDQKTVILKNVTKNHKTSIKASSGKFDIKSLLFTPNSRRLLAFSEREIRVIDCRSKKNILLINLESFEKRKTLRSFCFNLAGNSIIFYFNGSFLTVNIMQNFRTKIITLQNHTKHPAVTKINLNYSINNINAMQCIKGKLIFGNNSGLYHGDYLEENKNYKITRIVPFFSKKPSPINEFIISPDKKYVISWDQSKIRIWSLLANKLIKTLHGHIDKIKACNFSQKNGLDYLFSHGKHIKIWDFAKIKSQTLSSSEIINNSIVYDHFLFVVGLHNIKIYDLVTRKKLINQPHIYDFYRCSVLKNKDSYILAVTSKRRNDLLFFNWDGNKLQEIQDAKHLGIKAKKEDASKNNCTFIKYKKKNFLVTTLNNAVYFWDKKSWSNKYTKKPMRTITVPFPITQIKYHSETKKIAIVGKHFCYVYGMEQEKIEHKCDILKLAREKGFQIGNIATCTWNLTGKRLFIAGEKQYLLSLDYHNNKIIKFTNEHSFDVKSCSLNANESRIISSDTDGYLYLWDNTKKNFLSPIKLLKLNKSINQCFFYSNKKNVSEYIIVTTRHEIRFLYAPNLAKEKK